MGVQKIYDERKILLGCAVAYPPVAVDGTNFIKQVAGMQTYDDPSEFGFVAVIENRYINGPSGTWDN